MGHKLVLHIGTGKTGTTALQNFLWDNANKLREYGWDYPDILKCWCIKNDRDYIEGEKNGNLLKVSIIAHWEENKKKELWNIIIERLKNFNVIISDESIWGHPAIDTRAALEDYKRRVGNISIIVYLRRQDKYLESLWNQNVKERLETDDLNHFIHRAENWKSVEYLKKLNEIEELIGKDNLFVRVYEKKQFEGERGDLISDFFKVLGGIGPKIPEEWDDMILPKKKNQRLSGQMLLLKLLFNRAYLRHFPEVDMSQQMKKGYCDIKSDFEDFFRDDFNDNYHDGSFFSPEEKRMLLESFEGDNNKIAKYYLNRNNGKLFYDDDDSGIKFIDNYTDREKRIVERFANIIANLCKWYNKNLFLKAGNK